jgi:hypothetical protein
MGVLGIACAVKAVMGVQLRVKGKMKKRMKITMKKMRIRKTIVNTSQTIFFAETFLKKRHC